MDWFIDGLKRYADFTGRSHRTAFWMFILIAWVLSIVIGVVDSFLTGGFIGLLFSLAILLPNLAVGARRLHDTDRSGWWQLIALIPFVGWIVLIVFYVMDSDADENRFGPNPKVE